MASLVCAVVWNEVLTHLHLLGGAGELGPAGLFGTEQAANRPMRSHWPRVSTVFPSAPYTFLLALRAILRHLRTSLRC